VTWENWRSAVAKSVVDIPRSRSSSDTFDSSVAFLRAAAWAASRAAVSIAAAEVWPSPRPLQRMTQSHKASRPRPWRELASMPASPARWQLLQQRSGWRWRGPPLTGGRLQGTSVPTPHLPPLRPPPPGLRQAASPAGPAPRGARVTRGLASDQTPQDSAPSKARIRHTYRKNQENRRNNSQARKLTEVAGRISSSNARHAHSNPRSRVPRATTF
jgi:hypothetical protein